MIQLAPDNAEYDLASAQEFAGNADHQSILTLSALGPLLLAEFNQAEIERRDTETRWLDDLRQFRGQYDPDVLVQIGPNRSKAFVRKTRVKVKTVDSRVADLLFPAGSEKNWTIESTPVPSVSDDQKAQILKTLTQANQGQKPAKDVFDKAVLDMAKAAAKKMSIVVEDQLVEARYKKASVQAIHSCHLFGTGILKGPLVERKVRTRFVFKDGKWQPKSESYITPFVDYVPLWRWYPDMSATVLENCRFAYERHLMSKSGMADLAKRKSFQSERIKAYILANPDGQIRDLFVDNELKIIGERMASQNARAGQYEVLERWGWLDGHQLVQAGVVIPEERMHESFFSNVWLLPNGEVIKAVLQPINGVTWPYHLYYFDKDETSIFAEGLGTIMRDDQTMINAGTRMALDNGAITAGAMLEVNPGLLSSMEKIDEMHPWKIWLRNASQPGTRAVNAIDMPNHLNDLLKLVQVFETNADEVTAIPRYMSGENANQGAAGTASGMSMLMGAANIVIKDLITNWDEGVTRPFLQSLYNWNMQFNDDASIKGDFDVKARGTASLIAKEVRAQQLNTFAQLTANDLDAPYIKRDKLNQQRAEANELSDVDKTEEEMQAEENSPAAQQAEQQRQALQQSQMAEQTAKVDKLIADAQRILAQAEQIKSQAVATKVGAVYAAMQAGGVATERPQIAPAGDEILRSAGWMDATPQPSMSDLASAPPGQPVTGTDNAPQPQLAQTQIADMGNPIAQPQTGQVGARAGMETAAIE